MAICNVQTLQTSARYLQTNTRNNLTFGEPELKTWALRFYICKGEQCMKSLIFREHAIVEVESVKVPVVGLIFGKRDVMKYLIEYRNACIEAIKTMTAVMGAESVKHGGWIFVGKDEKGNRIIRCSHCGIERKNQAKSAYCRDCGAKMDIVFEPIEEVRT